MIRGTIAILALAFGLTAQAGTINDIFSDLSVQMLSNDFTAQGLNFKVGDQTSYNLTMASFIKGSMVMTVKSVTDSEVVITQDMDLGFLGKQNCEETIDPNTGELKKMVCNGQEQNKPEADYEVIDTKEDTIKVPAGTFTCLYIKVKNKADNTDAEQWVNPKLIPVMGLAKMTTTSQMGPVVVELKSFKKN
jgi:hypothetical protein